MEIQREIREIDLEEIKVSSSNVRTTDQNARIDELKESIKKHGLLQPVVLRGSYGSPPYELIVGQRRFLAHKALGKDTIRATFCGDLDDTQAKILSLTENMHRVELSDTDKAEAITALYVRYRRNDQRVAQELGLSLRTVRDYIRIDAEATPKAKKWLDRGNISKVDLKRVIDAAQGDPEKADSLLEKMPRLSLYEKRRAVDYGKKHPKASVTEIIKEGEKARQERTIILNLPKEISEALREAEEKLLMDGVAITEKALSEWLKNNGFLRFEF